MDGVIGFYRLIGDLPMMRVRCNLCEAFPVRRTGRTAAGLGGMSRLRRNVGVAIFVRFDLQILRNCWFLAGPTACGKSAAGCELAELLNAEIIALDSMSLYRGMDIGTAKPDAQARRRVPHHLIDVLDPHEEFSLADYVAAAESAAREVVGRGRVPLFVGGTGLYLRGGLRGVFEGPPAAWNRRREAHA